MISPDFSLGRSKAASALKHGDLFIAGGVHDPHIMMRVTHNEKLYDLVLSPGLPRLVTPGSLNQVRILDEVRLAVIGDDLGVDYCVDDYSSVPNGAVAFGAAELVIRVAGDGFDAADRYISLSTGLGVNPPDGVIWQRSWRLLWGEGDRERELMSFPARPQHTLGFA